MAYQEYPSKQILKAASDAPYLERSQELDLVRRWINRRDQQALHALTLAHMRLVLSLAFKFRRYGLPLADLIQEGHIGLLEAAARFDPQREVRFATYATWWVRAAMQDHILRNWSIVRGGTSSKQKALFFNLRKLRARIAANGSASDGRQTYEEIARALKVSVKDVAQMDARFSGADLSLDAPMRDDDGGGSTPRIEGLVSEEVTPDEAAQRSIDGERHHGWLNDAMAMLNARERQIIKARRLRENGATLEELGQEFGISKERVRQIEARALGKLREQLVLLDPEFSTYGRA